MSKVLYVTTKKDIFVPFKCDKVFINEVKKKINDYEYVVVECGLNLDVQDKLVLRFDPVKKKIVY